MDNNNFNQPMGQPGMNPQFMQPGMDPAAMNQQFMQPGMNPAAMNQQFAQPAMDMSQQFAQPAMDMGQQFAQPAMDMGQQFTQPAMETPVAPVAPDMSAVGTSVAPEMAAPEAPVAPDMATVGTSVAPEMVAPEAPVAPDMSAVGTSVAPDMAAPVEPAMVDEGTTVLTGAPNFGAPVNLGANNGFVPEGQQFAQPGMGVMPQQPGMPEGMPMQPMFGEAPATPVDNGKKPKKEKKGGKGKIIGLSVALAAVVALVVCGIIFLPNMLCNAKKKVKSAFENTFNYEMTDAEKNFANGIKENGGDAKIELNVSPNAVLQEYVGVSNLGVNINSSTSMKDKVSFNTVQVKLDDSELITVEIAMDENKIYVGAPELFEGYFSIPTTNIGTAFSNSPIMAGKDLSYTEIEAMDKVSLNIFNQDSAENYEEILDEIADMVKYKRVGKSKITVNGSTVKATKYKAFIKTDDAVDFLKKQAEAEIANAGIDGVDANTVNSVLDMVKAYLPDEFVLYIYVKDNKIVKMSSDIEINAMGQKANLEFNTELSDDAFYASVNVNAMGENVVTGIIDLKDFNTGVNGYINLQADGSEFNIDVTSTKDGDNLDLNAVVSADGEEICTANFKGFIKKNEFDFTLSAVVDGVDVAFSAKGTSSCTDTELTFDCSEFKVTASGQELVTGSLKATTTVGATNAKVPTGSGYDLTTITEDEFNTFIENNKESIDAWIKKIAEIPLFSSLGGGEEEVDPEPEVTLDDAVLSTYDSDATVKITAVPSGF